MTTQQELEKFHSDVKSMMSEDMPTDDESLKAKWQETGESVGLDVKTQDVYNPFWRFITELVTLPVKWLRDFMIKNVMPNLFLKFATGPWLKLLAWEMAVEPKLKRKAKININFIRVDASAVLNVPAGSEVDSTRINGVVYKLLTIADQSFAIGETEITILCEAQYEGEAYNLATGYYQVLPKTINGVVSVINRDGAIVEAGQDDETDDELRLRTRDKWDKQFSWHVEAVYRNIVGEFDGVNPENIYFNRAQPRGENSADALILFDVGEPSQSFIDNINNTIQQNESYGIGDDFLVVPMPTEAHDIVCEFTPVKDLSAEQESALAVGIENFIKAAFRENAGIGWTVTRTAPYETFSFGRLTFELFKQFGDELSQLRFTNQDISGGLKVAKINTLQVNKV